MKKIFGFAIVIVIALLVVTILSAQNFLAKDPSLNQDEVYVGITYGGNSVSNAKQLIDKVKNYTNLFILASGSLQRDIDSVVEIGDYAISHNLSFLPYFGNYVSEPMSNFIETAKTRWGNYFLGIYYKDEPGGKILDDYIPLENSTGGDSIMKTRYGDVVLEKENGVIIHYEIEGLIHLYLPNVTTSTTDNPINTQVYATFYPDGSIEIEGYENSSVSITDFNFPDYATYDRLLEMRPLKDIDEAAEQFTTKDQNIQHLSNSTVVFTSDYALYWFDYLSGYDVVLSQIGWNITDNQQISLVRGAANAQNKEWGIIVTWKYLSSPYLDSGQEIFNQMKTAYDCGAKYIVVFNFYETENIDGTMQKEHFDALESFWKDVVTDSNVIHGSIGADTVLILPKNYGWGMRWPQDKIWGIFKPENISSSIWNSLQSVLENHGLKVDIIYEDEKFPISQKYSNKYYWNKNE